MAEQKKPRAPRKAAAPKKVAAKAETPMVAEAKALSKSGRQRQRELLAQRGRVEKQIEQIFSLKAQLNEIDEELKHLI